MAVSYLRRSMTGPATFSLFVRRLPPGRGFLVAAGLEDCLAFLDEFSFTTEDLAWLPPPAKALYAPAELPVTVSPRLAALRDRLASDLSGRPAEPDPAAPDPAGPHPAGPHPAGPHPAEPDRTGPDPIRGA
jgi:hypothetical protein